MHDASSVGTQVTLPTCSGLLVLKRARLADKREVGVFRAGGVRAGLSASVVGGVAGGGLTLAVGASAERVRGAAVIVKAFTRVVFAD